MFITASDKIIQLETSVARMASILKTIDIFDLGRFVPYGLRQRIINILNLSRSFVFGKKNKIQASTCTTKDFCVTNDASKALDLLAVCRK
jgi:hypothetical protein